MTGVRGIGATVLAVAVIGVAMSGHIAGAQSACDTVGGAIDPDQTCHVDTVTDDYKLEIRFPVDYPDQQVVSDFLTDRRDGFFDYVAKYPNHEYPYELYLLGTAYRSGAPDSGTQSLVFDVGDETGVHPVTTYHSLNYDLSRRAPITFDTVFRPGTDPLAVLNLIVLREMEKRDPAGRPPQMGFLPSDYASYAITDDAITFFFNQDGLLPHVDGPFQVSVPRTELASILA